MQSFTIYNTNIISVAIFSSCPFGSIHHICLQFDSWSAMAKKQNVSKAEKTHAKAHAKKMAKAKREKLEHALKELESPKKAELPGTSDDLQQGHVKHRKRRRTAWGTADRALKDKFHFIDVCVLDGMSENGRSPVDDVYDEMQKKTTGYISSTFWYNLDTKWKFTRHNVYSSLPAPEAAQSVDPELIESILQAVDPNPPSRTPARFEKFLQFKGTLNETELY